LDVALHRIPELPEWQDAAAPIDGCLFRTHAMV
jgi:hypothetical protein